MPTNKSPPAATSSLRLEERGVGQSTSLGDEELPSPSPRFVVTGDDVILDLLNANIAPLFHRVYMQQMIKLMHSSVCFTGSRHSFRRLLFVISLPEFEPSL
jgi:hypothetical protein